MPLTLVLFGSTGDLAQKKILPALALMHGHGTFPQGSEIIAYSRRSWTDAEYRDFIRPALANLDKKIVEDFLQTVHYVQGTFDDPASYALLKESIHTDNVFLHLAVQPEFFAAIVEGLGKADLKGSVLIEKPFGHDRISAQTLEQNIEKYFSPEQIFRVDHYLGKAGLDALSKENFVPEHVATVSARIFSPSLLEGRGEFFDTIGEMRDVGQNHLLQMIAAVLGGNRKETLEQLSPDLSSVVRGQFEGYKSIPGVAPESQTETYFKLTAHSNDPRWAGVQLYLEAGKGLAQKKSEVVVTFKDGTEKVFDMDAGENVDYVTVLEAALEGERNRFVSLEEVYASWQFVDPVIEHFASTPLTQYSQGSDTLSV